MDDAASAATGEEAAEDGTASAASGDDEGRASQERETTAADGAPDGEPQAPETKPSVSHPGIRRALAEARGYLDDPPPPGRVRSSFAPGDARMIRADGPGWSMVARTDDIAFLLLDEMPGEILPVGRGPELPGLLTGLDALAVRPS